MTPPCHPPPCQLTFSPAFTHKTCRHFLSIYHVWGMSQVQNTGTGLLTPAQGSVHCTSSKPFCGSQQPLRKVQAPWWPFAASQFASAGPRCSWAETLCLLRARAREDALKKAQLWDWELPSFCQFPSPRPPLATYGNSSSCLESPWGGQMAFKYHLPFPFPCCLSTHPLTQHPALLFSPRGR